MHIFPEEAIVDGSPRDVQRAIRSGASVLNVAAAQIKPGTWEVSTNGAKPGDAYHDSMVASSELTPLGEGYSRLAVPQGTTANDLLREGVRRLVASLDGNVPDITFKRETGANPSDEVRTISADRIDARFSTQRQTDTPQFKAWFGEWTDPKAFTSKAKGPVSQAVDESGSPLVLYHATNGDFSEFEAGRPTINSTTFGDVETERHAIFTSPNEQFAEGYIRKGDGGNVMPVYMDIKAPMDLREGVPGEVINDIVENSDGAITHRDFYHLPADETWSLFDGEFGKNFVDAARKAGYDGAITTENDPDTGNSVEVYAAFD